MALARIVGMAAVLSLVALSVSAEWDAGFYLGVAQTRDIQAGAQGTIEGESKGAFGARLGYWFERVPWLGLAGDFSGFEVARDMRVLNGSLLLMVRPAPPHGGKPVVLEPYVAVGIARYESLLKVGETDRPLIGEPAVPVEEESYDAGPDFRAGVTWWLRKNWGLLAEYRYTRVRASFPSLPGDLTFKTHHANFGLVYRWDP